MNSGRLTGLARLTFGNRASQVYLGLVAAATVFVAVDTLLVQHQDASFAGVWLFFLAAPTIFAFFVGGGLLGDAVAESAGFLYPALVLSVLIQAAAIGAFIRLLRHTQGSAHPHGV
ncbi:MULTISPECIES: SCO4225 family membrane protein [unclassified Streptomyces]|uniref:SCO4225 family membrane protein n=1 Tax=unclassified Streptomyces TaxID=2593676 RepID=UPI003630A64D